MSDANDGFWSLILHMFKNDKLIRITSRIVLIFLGLAISISVILFFIDRSNGVPSEALFGLLKYTPRPVKVKSDTDVISTPIFNAERDALDKSVKPQVRSSEKNAINNAPSSSIQKAIKPAISQENRTGKNETNLNQGTNEGIIGGEANKIDKGNHTVYGNNFGVNGDVNVAKEVELQENDKDRILKFIEKFRLDNKTQTDCILVRPTNTTNSSKFSMQLVEFLKSKGYNAKECCYAVFTTPLRGLDFSMSEGCVTISVGAL